MLTAGAPEGDARPGRAAGEGAASAPGVATHYVKYSDPLLKEYTKKAFDATGMYDYGKFDVRMDQSGRYFFIDTNCNPALGPKELDMALSVILDLYGVSFYEILKRLILNTMREANKKERRLLEKLNGRFRTEDVLQ